MKPLYRAAIILSSTFVAAIVAICIRDAHLSGLFTPVTPGFAGSCKAIPGLVGAGDMQIDAADGLVFIAASNPRAPAGKPDPRDGVYAMTLAGEGLTRLAGGPADFHPHAISIGGEGGGGLTLMAIDRRADGKFAVDIFDVTVSNGTARLAQRTSIEGGLFTHPGAIVATGPDSFYVANETTDTGVLARILGLAMVPRGNVVYFDGQIPHLVAEQLNEPSGLALAPDGKHLYVGATAERTLITYESDLITGTLKEVNRLGLPVGPDKITLDAAGNLWVAGHGDLFARAAYARDASALAPSQIFKVWVADGIPQSAQPVYGDSGREIGAASVGVVLGKNLVIGSALDDKILDCSLP